MKVLLAIDESPFSKAAVEATIQQFRPDRAEVVVLFVVEQILMPAGPGGELAYIPDMSAIRMQAMQGATQVTEDASAKLRAAGFKVTEEIREGDPKTWILEYAADSRADLIIVGSHGRTGLDRFLMGSVSEAVARHAHCSVQIVRLPRK
jgi:nucleotide-binding universal stress UspA family protein